MKITKIIIFILSIFTFLSGAACSNPCDEVADRTIKCAKGQSVKEVLKEKKDLIKMLCEPHKDEVKACLKLSGCIEFNKCMKNVTNYHSRNIKKIKSESSPKKHSSSGNKKLKTFTGSGKNSGKTPTPVKSAD